jgi:hypothetical protein
MMFVSTTFFHMGSHPLYDRIELSVVRVSTVTVNQRELTSR